MKQNPEFGHHYQVRMDGLLDALSDALARADMAEEKLSYVESEWIKCMESNGLAL